MSDTLLDLTVVTYHNHKPVDARVLIPWEQVEMVEDARNDPGEDKEQSYVHLRSGKIVGVREDFETIAESLGVRGEELMGFGSKRRKRS